MEEVLGLSHLFMTVFLYHFAELMVSPAITDVTVAGLCAGKSECSLAIYLTGAQTAIIGLGSVVIMPWIGKMSDTYGRKCLLTLPITLSILPLVILAYSRTKPYIYAYYVLNILVAITGKGSVQFLALAYVADKVEETKRGSVFGILLGVVSSSFLFGNVSARFLSISSTFQVATAMCIIALVYMRVFLSESILKNNMISTNDTQIDSLLESDQSKKRKLFNIVPSMHDTINLLWNNSIFSKVAIVAFLSAAADGGLYAAYLYFLKERFHYNKNQFADLMIISGVSGSISQLFFIPILVPLMGEGKMLSIGLFVHCGHMILLSIAWSPWVPYAAATMSVVSIFTYPCLRSIASKQIGVNEQGKAQGFITGIYYFANIISTLAFTPLTAIFLSDNAPFHFPGFSILCCSIVAMMALALSIAIRPLPSPPVRNGENETLV